MSDELDPALARLLKEDEDGPDLIGITFESLQESLLNQGHQDGDKHSDIQQEESAEQCQPTQQELQKELNKQFATTIKRLEERREPHVQSTVHVLLSILFRTSLPGFKDSEGGHGYIRSEHSQVLTSDSVL